MNNQPGSHVGNNPTFFFSRGHPYSLQLLNKCRKDLKYLNNAEWERRRDHSTAGFLPGLAGELCVSQWPYRLDHDWLCRWPRAAAARQTQVFVWPWPSEQLFYAFIKLYIPQPGNSWSDRVSYGSVTSGLFFLYEVSWVHVIVTAFPFFLPTRFLMHRDLKICEPPFLFLMNLSCALHKSRSCKQFSIGIVFVL